MTSRLPAGAVALGVGLFAGMAPAQTILFDGTNLQITDIPAAANVTVNGPATMNNIQDVTESPVDFIGAGPPGVCCVSFTFNGAGGAITVNSINSEPEISANFANISLDLITTTLTSTAPDSIVLGAGGVLTLSASSSITNTVGNGVSAVGLLYTGDATSSITAAGNAIVVSTGDLVVNNNGGTIESTGGVAIAGGSGTDTITNTGSIIGGAGTAITLGAGDDTLNQNGGSITGDVDGGSGEDTLNLNAGTIASDVLGGDDADTITLDGVSISGDIDGGGGDDTIDLLSGSVVDVRGGSGADGITLDGATASGDLSGGDDDDTFTLTSGSFGGDLLGGDGSDDATIESTFSLASITGDLDGGDDVSTGDGFFDSLTIEASGTLTGEDVINWEQINIDGVILVLDGAGLVTSSEGGDGMFLSGSTLDFDNGFALTGNLTIGGGSTLLAGTASGTGVFSVSNDLSNFGTIDMSDGLGAGDTLTVGDDYTSASELLLDVALNATEAGDSLVIGDDILGTPTEITFTDTDPSGPPSFTDSGPGNGIIVVDNSAGGHIVDGDFIFDPVAHPTNELLKAPFAYTLSLEPDDILYLQSDVLAQVYGYAILSEVMREAFPILRDRLGDRRHNGFGGASNGASSQTEGDSAGVWARIDGGKRMVEHSGDFTSGEWDLSRGEAEIGFGIPLQVGGGTGVAGISVHAVRAFADASSGNPGADVAEVDATGFGAGASFAWFPGGGFYVDLQGRVTTWDADVEVDARGLDQDIDGFGWGASVEFGKRFPIGANTAITTRSRVVYTDVDFDRFTDDDGVEVSQDDSASVVIGPAVTIETLFPDNGVALYADVSVSRELLDESSVDASGFTFESGLEDTWGTIAVGMEAALADGTSAFIQADISSPFGTNFGDSLGYGLKAGVRIDF